MNLGRYQLGTRVPIRLQCLDSNGSPVMPDQVPVLKVWANGGTLIVNKLMPVEDKEDQVGLFLYELFLDKNFATGNYHGDTFYVSGALAIMTPFWFDVIPGGDAGGQVVSTFFYHRPQADFIVYQTEGGQIRFGSNPRFQ